MKKSMLLSFLAVGLGAAPAIAAPKNTVRDVLCRDTRACLLGRVPGCPETEQERRDLTVWYLLNCDRRTGAAAARAPLPASQPPAAQR